MITGLWVTLLKFSLKYVRSSKTVLLGRQGKVMFWKLSATRIGFRIFAKMPRFYFC